MTVTNGNGHPESEGSGHKAEGSPLPLREQLREARQRRRLLEETLQVRRLEAATRLTEAIWPWGLQTAWPDPTDLWLRARLATPNDPAAFVPPDQPSDRRSGRDWPLYQTETELGRLRMRSKLLVATNAYCKGLLRNIVNYVVGEGCQYEVIVKEGVVDVDPRRPGRQPPPGLVAEQKKAQRVLDEFLDRTRWNASEDYRCDGPLASTREREAVRRVIRDGEAILRLFQGDDGTTDVRWVESAQVRNPPDEGVSELDGWLFGIRHALVDGVADEERRIEYHIAYKSTEAALQRGEVHLGEMVPADQIVHLTGPDTDAVLRRGMPEFCYDTADALERAAALARNASAGAAFRAATAEIWEHAFGTKDQISNLVSGLATATGTNPYTGATDQIERPRAATVRRVPEGQKLVPLPADNTPSYLQGVQGDLRQSATPFCAPEYLASGDASNANYASTKEAGTPFTLQAKALQSYYTTAFKRVIWKVLAWAAECGRFNPEALRLLDLKVEAPTVIHRNDLEKAQRDQVLIGTGVVDRQTISMEWGYDPAVVRDGIKKWNAEMGPEGAPLKLPGDKGLDMDHPGGLPPGGPGKGPGGAGGPGGGGPRVPPVPPGRGGPVREAKDAPPPTDELHERATLIAEFLYHLYGKEALQHLGEGILEAWSSADHPRDQHTGRFIKRGSAEAVATAQQAVGDALKGRGGDPETVRNHLAILTVKQLRALHRQHGVKKIPSYVLREHLVGAVMDKLATGNDLKKLRDEFRQVKGARPPDTMTASALKKQIEMAKGGGAAEPAGAPPPARRTAPAPGKQAALPPPGEEPKDLATVDMSGVKPTAGISEPHVSRVTFQTIASKGDRNARQARTALWHAMWGGLSPLHAADELVRAGFPEAEVRAAMQKVADKLSAQEAEGSEDFAPERVSRNKEGVLRWLERGKAPAPARQAAASPPRGGAAVNLDDPQALADAVHEAGRAVPDLITGEKNTGDRPAYLAHKAPIADVYDALKPRLGGASLDDFKEALMRAQGAGALELGRHDMTGSAKDLAGGMDTEAARERVARSEALHPLGGARFHTVNTNSPAALGRRRQ